MRQLDPHLLQDHHHIDAGAARRRHQEMEHGAGAGLGIPVDADFGRRRLNTPREELLPRPGPLQLNGAHVVHVLAPQNVSDRTHGVPRAHRPFRLDPRRAAGADRAHRRMAARV